MTEKAAQTTDAVWEETGLGQSCSEYCKQDDRVCDESYLATITDSESLYSQISDYQVCALPLLSGCGDLAGSYDPENQYCYYPDNTCVAQNRTAPAALTCDSKVDGFARFCVCGTVEPQDESAGNTRNVGALLPLLLVPFLFAINSRLALVVLVLFSLASSHNWINSNSRSKGASAVLPCKPARTDLPHAQVGPDQAFQIEWMNGHGDYTYFVILHSKYADKMNVHTFNMLEEYIADAPAGTNKALDPQYQRLHRKDEETLDNLFKTGLVKNFFAEFINKTDPRFISRPSSFGGEVGAVLAPNDSSPIWLVSYKPESLADDALVSYNNAKYPWIEAVYRYKIVALVPNRPDTANFYIPGRAGFGRYIVQYLWRGYRDCIDIDYKDSAVSNIYGYPLVTPRWQRIDHCLFENARIVFDSSMVVTDPQYCLDQCTNGRCWGVNVVPLMAPESVYQGFTAPEGDNWLYPNIYGTDMYVPWDNSVFNATAYLANPSATKYMCYTVQPAQNTDTTDDYTISDDPYDPIFYSTCYYKSTDIQTYDDYVDKPNTATMTVDWRFVDKCIDCASQSIYQHQEVTPQWTVSDTCVNCDLEPVDAPVPSFPSPSLVESSTQCDGFGGVWSKASHYNCTNPNDCYKQLYPVGRDPSSDVSIEECRAMASQDPECSNFFVSRQKEPTLCYCYSNKPCCKTCSRAAASFDTYQVSSPADPTCQTGVKSADGNYCCSPECGSCTSSGYGNYLGYCCSTCITRPCATYGPPCALISP